MQVEELFDRLSAHGIGTEGYLQIQRIVTLSFPQWSLRFYGLFGDCTIDQALKRINRDKAHLGKNHSLTVERRIELEKSISFAEMVVWATILEVNSDRVGPWKMQTFLLPTGKDEDGQPLYHYPSVKVIAVHGESNEEQEVIVLGEELKEPPKRPQAWRRAYDQLGIWPLVYRGTICKGVLSRRDPQGWTVFTKHIIPRLYEYLVPFYKMRGHHSEKRRRLVAEFSKGLFEDMLGILYVEHPDFFAHTTVEQIKADIQHYLEDRRNVWPPSKKPQKSLR